VINPAEGVRTHTETPTGSDHHNGQGRVRWVTKLFPQIHQVSNFHNTSTALSSSTSSQYCSLTSTSTNRSPRGIEYPNPPRELLVKMPYYCDPCERWFNTANSYNQHMDYSPAHNQPDFECSYCDRLFSTENSLHQHCSSAAGHPYCSPCKRMFMNMNNLMQVRPSISFPVSQSNNFPAPAFQNPHGQ
jgi:uncharacterized C2H2 Zn-finger protein